MARRVKEVVDMEIDEISLVDIPANQHAKVTIAKRASEEDNVPEDEIYNENGEILDADELEEGDVVFDSEGAPYVVVDEYDDEDELIEKRGHEIVNVAQSYGTRAAKGAKKYNSLRGKAGRSAKMARSSMGQGAAHGRLGMFAHGEGASYNVGNVAGRAEAAGRSAGSAVAGGARRTANQVAFTGRAYPWTTAALAGGAGAGAGAGGMAVYDRKVKKSFADEVRSELSKALTDIERDEVIAKALEQVDELSSSLWQAEEIAKSERDLRLSREYYEVAKGYNVPVDPAELAPVLMHMAEVLPYEDCEVIHKALASAGALIYDEIGYAGGGDNQDILSQVNALADEQYVFGKSADGNVSKAQTVVDIFSENPAAYDEYLAERGR